jgi:hypothetical protein
MERYLRDLCHEFVDVNFTAEVHRGDVRLGVVKRFPMLDVPV